MTEVTEEVVEVTTPAVETGTEPEFRTRGLPDPNVLIQEILKHRGWDIRSGQITMIEEVDLAIEDGYDVIASAPVGIGKTLAYLIAALPSDRQIKITTSGLALQNQIILDELPLLAKDLFDLYGYELSYEVIKGKSNYVCLESANSLLSGDPLDEADFFEELGVPEMANIDMVPITKLVEHVTEKMELSKSGVPGVILDSSDELRMIDDRIRSGLVAKRCINHGGRWWDDVMEEGDEEGEGTREPLPHETIVETRTCPQGVAYAKAMKADIVVMNTSLLAAELQKSVAIESPYVPTQIRGSNIIVVDEAHHLVKILTESMRVTLSADKMVEKIDTLMRRIVKKRPDLEANLNTRTKDIITRFMSTMIDIEGRKSKEGARGNFASLLFDTAGDINSMLETTEGYTFLKGDPIDSKDFKSINKNRTILQNDVVEPLKVAAVALLKKSEMNEEDRSSWAYDMTITPVVDETEVSTDIIIDLVPIDLSFFRQMLEDCTNTKNPYIETSGNMHVDNHGIERTTLILCSGTITEEVGNVIGVPEEDLEYVKVPSPFASKNIRICVTTDITLPSNKWEWYAEAGAKMGDAIQAAGGRTMVLTTSSEAVGQFSGEIYEKFGNERYPIYWQGDGNTRSELIEGFTKDEHSLLFGTKGFWEGVNVVGPSLSQVIMDKLPFPMPNDPVAKARRKFVERQGGDPFIQVDIDMVAIDLEQGRGRLLRAVKDQGGVLITDPRARSKKNYVSLITKLFEGDILITTDFSKYLEWMEWINPDNGMTEEERPSEDGWEMIRRPAKKRRRVTPTVKKKSTSTKPRSEMTAEERYMRGED